MDKKINKTIMQYFEWYLPADCGLWKKVASEASYLVLQEYGYHRHIRQKEEIMIQDMACMIYTI